MLLPATVCACVCLCAKIVVRAHADKKREISRQKRTQRVREASKRSYERRAEQSNKNAYVLQRANNEYHHHLHLWNKLFSVGPEKRILSGCVCTLYKLSVPPQCTQAYIYTLSLYTHQTGNSSTLLCTNTRYLFLLKCLFFVSSAVLRLFCYVRFYARIIMRLRIAQCFSVFKWPRWVSLLYLHHDE